MARHFLLYSTRGAIDGDMLTHIGSDQLRSRGVDVNDTVWIVNLSSNRVLILGRIVVAEAGDRDKIAALLGRKPTFASSWYVMGAVGEAQPIREVDLMPIADQLRFQSEKDRFTIVDGRISSMQFRSMRLLTDDSGALLEKYWEENT